MEPEQIITKSVESFDAIGDLKVLEDDGREGRFAISNLYPGHGEIVGNTLRRILLSSLQGAVTVGVQIVGVRHEFSRIPDVLEDVTEIIRRLKKVRFKFLLDDTALGEPFQFRVEVDEARKIYARDINTGGRAEVLTPDLHLATLNEGGIFYMTLWARSGFGYAGADENKIAEMPHDMISIDAIFKQVVPRVTFYCERDESVEQEREQVILSFSTDGSVTPTDAVAISAKIMKEQLTIFTRLQDEQSAAPLPKGREEEQVFNENLYRSVDELELSVRSANCLQNANIRYVGELVQKTEAEMLKTKNFGRKSLRELKDILEGMNLSLNMKLEGWSPEQRRK
ncbi:MAG: DNA-directed RNA polymerase subunit alpha [Myxococcota bacterium]|nr:DNA-directed RNA polymerase subunit alpha [Myxococcota bacterium]